MDVQALQARLAAFAAERGWDELHNPRNLAIALAGEAGMLLDLFRWLTDAQSQRIESEYKREAAAEAIADLILHTLRLADKLDIDVERAIAKKLAENDANYPRPVSAHAPPVVVASVAMPAPAQAEKTEKPEKIEKTEKAAKAAKADKKETARPVEGQKAAAPPEPVAPAPPEPVAAPPAPAPREEKRAAEPPKPPADKALPTWLDGILPTRSTGARKKLVLPPKAAPEPLKPPEPPKPFEPAIPPEAPQPDEAAQALEPPPVVEPIEAAPPPRAAEPEPEQPPKPQPPPERYTHLNTDAAKGFAKALAKRVDSARSDDPLLRELHDEVETLRRTLYSSSPKYLWMGESLKTIRAILEEAATHSVGEEIRAHDYIAQIDRMLSP